MPGRSDALPRGFVLSGAIVASDGIERARDVVVHDGLCTDVVPPGSADPAIPTIDLHGLRLIPGMIDLHVHGATGHEFVELTPGVIDGILAELGRHGVTSALATISSEPIEIIVDTLRTFADPAGWASSDGARVLGVHLEGPYLAQEQRGAHRAAVVRAPTATEVGAILAETAALRMVTIAPELPRAIELVAALAARGVLVSIGHSAAAPAIVAAAQAAGARHFTHLWSGMSNLHRIGPWRRPGLIETALASTGMTAEVIADGKHLPAELLEIARACFGPGLCIVSDAIMGAGLPEGAEFGPPELRCRVEHGVAVVIGADSFAGSTTLLDGALRHVVTDLGWGLADSVRMVTEVPAQIIGEGDRLGRVAPGYTADFTILDDDLTVRATIRDGRWLHDAR
ncbi:MAG TPA: N-acetylglucosamine-6-phosphate deacetylase [Actinopolymorphaceae bacterium]